jgi:putative membrane protein
MINLLAKYLSISLKGFCMGAADIVPGVSGGTMALALGVYKQFIEAIKSFDLIWLKSCLSLNLREIQSRPHFGFLIPLIFGLVCAIIFFTKIISLPSLLITNPEAIYALFSGLVLGSAIILLKDGTNVSALYRMSLIFGGLSFGMFVLTVAPTNLPDTTTTLFLAGVLATSAMVLPGVSGSLILLIIGKYATILNALDSFNLHLLIPFSMGALTGLIAMSRVLSWAINQHQTPFKLIMCGILTASLYKIWPFQNREYFESDGVMQLVDATPYIPELNLSAFYALFWALMGLTLVIWVTSRAIRP